MSDQTNTSIAEVFTVDTIESSVETIPSQTEYKFFINEGLEDFERNSVPHIKNGEVRYFSISIQAPSTSLLIAELNKIMDANSKVNEKNDFEFVCDTRYLVTKPETEIRLLCGANEKFPEEKVISLFVRLGEIFKNKEA